MNECPECNSKDVRVAIHTDYKECNKCFHYWETSDKNQREMSELVKAILKITNESSYGWLDIDSVEAEQIKELIKHYLNTKER